MDCYSCKYSRPGLISDECSGYYCELYDCPLSAIAGLNPHEGDCICYQSDDESDN